MMYRSLWQISAKPVVYHYSEPPSIMAAPSLAESPQLLCILNTPELLSLAEGMFITYESTPFGALVTSEYGNAVLVEPIQPPAGKSYRINDSIPLSSPLYLYVQRDLARFYDHLLPIPPQPEITLWWMGKGIYYRTLDNIWRHENCLVDSPTLESFYLSDKESELAIANTITDANHNIQIRLRMLGLIPAHKYRIAHQWMCESLAKIGDQWCLPWCWSEREQNRFWRNPLKYYLFNWSYS